MLVLAADAPSGKQRVYFGTYTGKSSTFVFTKNFLRMFAVDLLVSPLIKPKSPSNE
jgi:hypothetical protein